MTRSIFVLGFVLGLGTAAAIGFARSDDGPKPRDGARDRAADGVRGGAPDAAPPMPPEVLEAMQAWEKWATPGAPHEALAKAAGEWEIESTFWMAPGMPPQQSKMTASATMELGGRFLFERVRGDVMGQPFEGLAIVGYDNGLKRQVSLWIDNMSTGFMRGESTESDGARTVHRYWGTDPLTGAIKQTRAVDTWIDADTRRSEMFDTGPDGTEFKTMNLLYRRAK